MTTQIRPDELIRILKPEFLSIGSGGGVHAGPGIDIVGGVTVGIGYDTILLYDAALVVAAEFPATNAGFAAAIAAAAAGDCIQLPMTLTLTAAHTINGDIILRGPCEITANGDYGNLLTLDGGATADNIEVSYTTTTGAGGAAIYSSTGCYLRHVNAVITGVVAGPLCGALLIDIDPNSRINDCYFEATGNWGGATRTGLRVTSPGGGTRNRLIVEGCIGYAHNNTAAARCYGIYVAGSASVAGEIKFTVVDGCIGYGYAQWNNGIGWGIYAEDCLLDSCIGYGNGGDTIGIHIVNAYAFSCSGHATHEAAGVQEAIGILVGGNGEAYSCRAVVTTTGGVFEYGFYCDGADPIVCGGYGHGDTADVYVDAGTTAHIRGVAYDSVAGAGTLSLLAGDRVVMDLDGDTYVTALITDDEIHVYINGAEDFRITANIFNVLAGSGIGMADDTWIGLVGAGSFIFDATPAPDQIKISDADFNFITAAHGIIHVDGVAAGELLLADGTRYVPSGWFLAGTVGQTYTFPAVGGTIPTGTGVANRVAYWSGANTLTSDAGLTYNAATDSLTAGDFFTGDGGTFGIAGNELLTVNAAGTMVFSGCNVEVTGGRVYVEADIDNSFFVRRVNNALPPHFLFQRARVGPAAVQTGDNLGQILWKGYDGAAYNMGAIVIAVATENWGIGSQGTKMMVQATANGAAAVTSIAEFFSDRVKISGKLGVGIDPGSILDVYQTVYTPGSADAFRIRTDGGGGLAIYAETNAANPVWRIATFANEDLNFYLSGSSRVYMASATGNVGIGTAVFGTNAVTVLGIANGTAPTTSPVNMIQIFSVDSSDATATLGLRTEQAVEAGAPTFGNKLKVLIDGVEYWIGLDAV